MTQETLRDWEKQQSTNAHHRAMIMQILKNHPDGLTVQQIVEKEIDYFGYSFLTDNRLRELRAKVPPWVKTEGEKPQKWIAIKEEREE